MDRPESYRQQRVASLINIAIVECLERGKKLDIRLIDSPLTITKVVVTGDLKLAKCYFMPFNTKLSEAELLEALNNSKYAIRDFVTHKIDLKYSPDIRFFYDHGFDNERIVNRLLDKL